MIAPIFTVCAASKEVNAVIGGDHVRLYPFGLHDDVITYPYVVWQNIGGAPENYLGNRPDVDMHQIQIDVYANTPEDALTVGIAIRDAVEPHAYVTRWGGQSRDAETLKYRFSFDVDWYVHRK